MCLDVFSLIFDLLTFGEFLESVGWHTLFGKILSIMSPNIASAWFLFALFLGLQWHLYKILIFGHIGPEVAEGTSTPEWVKTVC